MCDYSLEHRESREAVVGEELTTKNFSNSPNSPTRGFSAPENPEMAVCLLPGTELKFEKPIRIEGLWGLLLPFTEPDSYLARFRQINLESAYKHHDAIELETGRIILLNDLRGDQKAIVLQLPAFGYPARAQSRDSEVTVLA